MTSSYGCLIKRPSGGLLPHRSNLFKSHWSNQWLTLLSYREVTGLRRNRICCFCIMRWLQRFVFVREARQRTAQMCDVPLHTRRIEGTVTSMDYEPTVSQYIVILTS